MSSTFKLLKIHTHTANAIPTAEGAIEIAISETPITIHGSKSLVLGYGKIGKILTKDLYGLGAETFAAARKHADLAMIEGHGYEPLPFTSLKNRIHEFDIIFNTVPSLILGGEVLKNVRKDALVIDLASKPGGAGFFFCNAKSNIKYENYSRFEMFYLSL